MTGVPFICIKIPLPLKNGEMFLIHQGWNEVRITPEVTDEQAREWADKWLDTNDYIKLFGEPAE